MNSSCDGCDLKYEREPGFFLGAIYINYGLTAVVSTIAFPILVFALKMPNNRSLLITMAFVLCFPLWFFRYARSLWLGFDQLFDPGD